MRSLVVATALALAAPASAADPWHLTGWSGRAVVAVTKPAAEPDVDAAGVKVLLHGRGRPDGADLRVTDAAGKQLPFQVVFHDPGRYALVSFRCPDPKQRYHVYFGNPQAARSADEVVADPRPGAGPPKGAWVPKFGLVLATARRPEKADNPRTVEQLAKLLAESPGPDGARYQRRISDGFNPFGSSDNYISMYRGWLRLPKDASYTFCTASNEASFCFLDGKELVSWPGRHTADRGARGEVNSGPVQLTAGLHYVEYYHEEVTLEQMAFLGWKGVPEGPHFAAIPEAVFTAPHAAEATAYESPGGPLPAFEPAVVDSVWPESRPSGQYTRVRFRAGPGTPGGAMARWDFGDGQTAAGAEAEHVYTALGRYTVSMTVGPQAAKWPLDVFEIENVTDQFPKGDARAYARAASGYDRAKLDEESLKELASLLAEAGDAPAALAAGREFVARFPKADPARLASVQKLVGDCALAAGKAGVEPAIAAYHAALAKESPLADRLDALAKLIRLYGVETDQPAKVVATRELLDAVVKGERFDEKTSVAYQQAMISLGDAFLWHGNAEQATEYYRRAERQRGPIPPAVRQARVGAYPGNLRQYLAAGQLDAGLELLDLWERTFPTDKPKGQTLYWRAKYLAARGDHLAAARHLARAVGLAPGAGYETEARWLLAESLGKLGRADEAKVELAKLVRLGVADEFSAKAKAKLAGK